MLAQPCLIRIINQSQHLQEPAASVVTMLTETATKDMINYLVRWSHVPFFAPGDLLLLVCSLPHVFGADLVEIYSHLSLRGALTGEPLKLLSSQSAFGCLFGLPLHHIQQFYFLPGSEKEDHLKCHFHGGDIKHPFLSRL